MEIMEIIKQQEQPSLAMLQTKLMTILSVREVREVFDCGESVVEAFSPSSQYSIVQNEHNVWFGKYPSLVTINIAFPKTSEGLVVKMLFDLEKHICASKKLDEIQFIQLSQMIVSEFYFLKISELILFFWKCKSGEIGKFYGQIDPLNLLEWLRNFVYEYRKDAIDADFQRIKDAYNRWHDEGAVKGRDFLRELPAIMKALNSKEDPESEKMPSSNTDKILESAMGLVNNTAGLSKADQEAISKIWEKKYGCTPQEYINKQKK